MEARGSGRLRQARTRHKPPNILFILADGPAQLSSAPTRFRRPVGVAMDILGLIPGNGQGVVTQVQFRQPASLESVFMVAELCPRMEALMAIENTNMNQFRTWIKDARPEDLVTIAPLLFSRIGTLEQSQQERCMQEVQRDPQAKRALEKMQNYTR